MNEQVVQDKECCGGTCQAPVVTARPSYRSVETGQGVTLEVALPGVRKDQLQISSSGSTLEIRARREDTVPGEWTVKRELPRPGAYELRVRLHGSLDPARTGASLENGVLRLRIPKREEALPRRIEVA